MREEGLDALVGDKKIYGHLDLFDMHQSVAGRQGYYHSITKGVFSMKFPGDLGEKSIRDVVKEHPVIGEILAKHDIACVECSVGVCLLKDVVSIHGLSADEENMVESEIKEYLTSGA